MRISDFKALTFDVYGTLIDWESGMVEALRSLTEKADQPLTRDEILQTHARHESSQQRYTPGKRYAELLAIVYRRLAEEWGVTVSRDECLAYGNSIRNWPVFADSVDSLRYLKQHFKLVVLSNVDNDSFAHSNKKLGEPFDAIYTAEDVGAYKPAQQNFAYMLDKLSGLGIVKDEILHTAESLFHDHVPANKLNMTCCHIYRRHDQQGFGATMEPEAMPQLHFRFTSMAALVQAVKDDVAAS